MRNITSSGIVVVAGAVAISLLAAPGAFAVCGDGVRESNEACDGVDFGDQTCTSVTGGFAPGGTLACNPDCTLETSDCRRSFLESLIPASRGPRQNRCHLEWGTVGTVPFKNKSGVRVCTEGDPTCDQDQDFNQTCLVRLQVCFNVPDPRLGDCEPGRIIRFDLLAPKLASSLQESASAVLNAGASAAPEQSAIEGASVRFGPPLQDFTCGSGTVTIPLKGQAGRAKPGKLAIRARTSDNSGRVKSIGVLKLVCMP